MKSLPPKATNAERPDRIVLPGGNANLRAASAAWLRALGFDPNAVPLGAELVWDEKSKTVACPQFVRDEKGHIKGDAWGPVSVTATRRFERRPW